MGETIDREERGDPAVSEGRVLPAADLDRLVDCLGSHGYEVLAPVVRGGTLTIAPIESADGIAHGWRERQEAGTHRLENDDSGLHFAAVNGSHSWKEVLFPPRVTLWRGRRAEPGEAPTVEPEPPDSRLRALLGVRPCDVRAIAVQDRVLMGGEHVDADYSARRQNALIIAVNCGRAAPTCFCVSAGTGPRARSGFDIALTEIIDELGHWFLVEAGTPLGREIVDELALEVAEPARLTAADRAVAAATDQQRRLPANVAAGIGRSPTDPLWDRMAARCLSCGNCTMVCPTCFCVSVEEGSDLTLDTVERSRRWESCFGSAHSYIHGGSVHRSTGSRYRQWMTHKLSSWVEQFGMSGCVGCGRCITWCPVGIDITQEANALLASRGGVHAQHE